jgi:hypothetical protein
MTRARICSIVVAVLLVGFSSHPVVAIYPAASAVIVYGGTLAQPIVLRPASPEDFPAFSLLWWNAGRYSNPDRTVQGDPQLASALKDRPYVNLAIFWGGPYKTEELKPENASQHGRFYPPTASEPALVVVTTPDMQKKANPIPKELAGFRAVWSLSRQDLTTLKGVGFPGI